MFNLLCTSVPSSDTSYVNYALAYVSNAYLSSLKLISAHLILLFTNELINHAAEVLYIASVLKSFCLLWVAIWKHYCMKEQLVILD